MVWIKAVQNTIKVWIELEIIPMTKPVPFKDISPTARLEAIDDSHVSGSMGVFTNDAKDTAFDFIVMNPTPCVIEPPV